MQDATRQASCLAQLATTQVFPSLTTLTKQVTRLQYGSKLYIKLLLTHVTVSRRAWDATSVDILVFDQHLHYGDNAMVVHQYLPSRLSCL